MKAAVVESVGKLVVRDLPEPKIGTYEARCEMLYGSVCAGTDTHLVHGHPPFCDWVAAPFILGHESIGRVVSVGAKVRNLNPGELITRVGCPPVGDVACGWGGFAEVGIATDWRAMRQDRLNGWQEKTVNQVLPADFDPRTATMMITWRETLSYLKRIDLSAGQSLLVIGSGGNGLAFAAHAHHLGARSTLIGSLDRQDSVAQTGATLIDYKTGDVRGQARANAPDGYDVAIDVVGRPDTVKLCVDSLKSDGTLAVYGFDGGGYMPDMDCDAAEAGITVYQGGYDEAETHDDVVALIQAGKLDATIWLDLDQVIDLADITHAFTAIRARSQVKPLVKLQS